MIELVQTLRGADIAPIRLEVAATDTARSHPFAQQGRQFACSLAILGKCLRVIETDPTEGQAGGIEHPISVQREIAVRMLRRVIDQPQMRQIVAQRLGREETIISRNPGIAVNDQEGFAPE